MVWWLQWHGVWFHRDDVGIVCTCIDIDGNVV